MAAAEDTIVPLAKKLSTGEAKVVSTYDFKPQVAKPGPARFRAENPTMPIKKGPPNNLVSGTGFVEYGRTSGLQTKFPGISSTGWQPPDCDLAVGPLHAVQVVNSSVAFFRKADGAKTFQQDFTQFFASLPTQTDFLFDPKAFYDPISKRFMVLALEMDATLKVSQALIAISDDVDPNGSWFMYRINTAGKFGNEDAWLDYPGFSCNKDSVLVTGNMFGFAQGAFGAVFVVIPKAPLLNGGTANASTFYDQNAFTAQTARSADASLDRLYTMSLSFSNSQTQIHAITGLPNAPRVTSTTLAIPSFIPPLDLVRGPNGVFLDSLDPRAFTSVYRAGSIAAAHNVSVSASDRRVATRWYEIQTKGWPTSGSQPTLFQSGTIGGASGESLHMPAININKRGAISVLMSRTSSSVMADVMISSRVKTDVVGKMSVPKRLAGSRGIFNFAGNRWGDYFAVAIDPNDDTTFWGNAETCGANGEWATEIVTWKVNDSDTATAYNFALPKVTQGTFQRGNAASLTAVDNNTYDVRTASVVGLGQVATWEGTAATNLTPTTVEYLALRWNTSGPTLATQFVFLFNWSKNEYVAVSTKSMKTPQGEVQEIVATDMSKYVKADGSVKVAIRSLQPPRNNAMPAAYVFKVDQLQILGIKTSN